ncbi:MAG: lipocalin family protein [Lentisphaeria bacterium]|nr:lipocalin family protein [Lentisphaeria bacterium]
MKRIFLSIVPLLFTACVSKPNNIEPIKNFELDSYLGKWYEIARLDHGFERGLEQVSANYSMREDGGVKVVNKGYNQKEKEWDEAIGKAYFVDDRTTGFLEVSFFGPFYGSYIIWELGKEYEYAFVCGPSKKYLWFLARTPYVDENMKKYFYARAKEEGFDLEGLIWVEQ